MYCEFILIVCKFRSLEQANEVVMKTKIPNFVNKNVMVSKYIHDFQ